MNISVTMVVMSVHFQDEINVRISLGASSEEACSRWLSSAKKVSKTKLFGEKLHYWRLVSTKGVR